MKRDEWPEFTPEETRQVAASMAEEVRFLNHATGRHAAEALRWPSDVDSIVTELAVMAQRLPQLLEQLVDRLHEQLHAGFLEVNHGPYAGKPLLATATAWNWLSQATGVAEELHRVMDQARQVTATISGMPEDGDG